MPIATGKNLFQASECCKILKMENEIMNFKKILALLLAVMMVMSFAACGETKDEGGSNATTTAPQETEPQETEPEETEPQIAEVTFFTMTMTDEEGNTVSSMYAYPGETGTVHVDYVKDITKRGEISGDAMATITEALAASGLVELNGMSEGDYSAAGGAMFITLSDDSTLSADFYGEIPEEFLNGYAAMEACFDILTADLEEYVPAPVEGGEIAESDRTALNAILENMTLEGPADSYAITGFAKDEYFAESLGLSSDEGVASGLNFAPMMMSVAYSLNIVTVEEGTDVNAVAEDFESNIDWLKWVCVQPSDVLIATQGNQVLCLLAADAAYTATATAIEAAGWTTYTTLQNPNM